MGERSTYTKNSFNFQGVCETWGPHRRLLLMEKHPEYKEGFIFRGQTLLGCSSWQLQNDSLWKLEISAEYHCQKEMPSPAFVRYLTSLKTKPKPSVPWASLSSHTVTPLLLSAGSESLPSRRQLHIFLHLQFSLSLFEKSLLSVGKSSLSQTSSFVAILHFCAFG